MKTEKLLISSDQSTAEAEISKLQSHISKLNELHTLFENLDLGKMDQKMALSLLADRGQTVSEIFLNIIASNCFSVGNVNKHFVRKQVEAQQGTVDHFKEEVRKVLEQIGLYFDYSKYSYNETDRTYFVSDKSKDDVIENHKIYLTDPKEIELYLEFEKTFKSLESLDKALCKYKGNTTYYSLMQYFENTIHLGGTTLSFNKKKVLELFRKTPIF
ncbi:hypothetical protein [Flavobacterium aquicola]|uniref:Uncharacterized protein n=1 Tax=Flavobacterium aquicola TaxID=1682742 RepID=A0A3E0E055_9FLAO|nr:hypothetical protein [Flavobacterium aquicola]REG90256.1 hypothetical protein C8P67_1266 [Flavobacterium aquicola]